MSVHPKDDGNMPDQPPPVYEPPAQQMHQPMGPGGPGMQQQMGPGPGMHQQQFGPGPGMHQQQMGPGPGMHQQMMPAPVMQQQSTTNVVVMNQQPTIENRLVLGSVYGHRDWTSGLFGCFEDGGGALQTFCCWECTLMEISAKLNENICVTNCVPGSLVTLRTRLRTLGGIRGSICKDYCAFYCFPMCTICQMQREIKAMQL